MATAVLTGTLVPVGRSAGIVAGSKTLIITLTGDTWVTAGGTFDAQRQAILNGIDSAQSEAHGWDVEVKAKAAVGEVVRTSNTQVTVTFAAQAAYAITAVETITVTIPASALAGGVQIVATPTFAIAPANWTFYCSVAGNDSNNGLSPDATTANTNKPWLTVGKSMNTGSLILPGDTVIIGPGYFYSEACVPIAAIASVALPSTWQGDPTNAQGFKDSSGVRLAAGIPWVTTRTAAEGIDSNIAAAGTLLTLGTNKPSGMSFSRLCLEVRVTGTCASWDIAAESDITFTDCRLIGQTILAGNNSAPTAGRNITFRRCEISCQAVLFLSATTAAASADADLAILIEECFIVGYIANSIAIGAGGGNIGGGITIKNSILICSWTIINTLATRISTVSPITLTGNLINCYQGFQCGTIGQVIDGGYNRYWNAVVGHTNVTAAATSKFGTALNLVLPHLVKWGLEMPRADFLGWTDAAHANQKFSASGSVTADFRGRTVRPWGAGASIGCWQVPDVVQDTSSAITGGGANSLKLTGAGEASFYVPVDALASTISVRTKSTSYGGTNYPQICVCANPSIGITANQITAATDGSDQTVTSPSFTPTAKGVVEVRLISRSSSVSSLTYFDNLTTP